MIELLSSDSVLEYLANFGALGLFVFFAIAVFALIRRSRSGRRVSGKHGHAAGRDVLVRQIEDVAKGGVFHDKSKTAGRDIIRNTHTHSTTNVIINNGLDRQAIFSILRDETGLPDSQLNSILGQLEEHNQTPMRQLENVRILSQSLPPVLERRENVDRRSDLNMDLVHTKIDTAHKHLNNGEFLLAHRDFDYAISHSSDIEPEQLGDVLKYYLHSGLVCYGIENRVDLLEDIAQRISESGIELDTGAIAAMANVVQEISTRSTDVAGLNQAVSVLEKFKETPQFSADMANALGLAYRRLGERGEVSQLDEAIKLFNMALDFDQGDALGRADIFNNLAIAHIRRFESEGLESDLESAKNCLIEGIAIVEDSSDYRSFMVAPKLFNNYGNHFKQLLKMSFSDEVALTAIQKYRQTEKWWKEETAPYEWAMVQKNIAEVKLVVADNNPSSDDYEEVIERCLVAIRHRSLDHSPFQWIKTVSIALRAQLGLVELGSPVDSRVRTLIQQAEERRGEWTGDAYKDFWVLVEAVERTALPPDLH